MDSQALVTDALSLAAERVTGDDLQAKARRRHYIQEIRAAVMIGGEAMPSRQELAEALGDPDDAAIRHAIDDLAGPAEGE